MDYKQLGHLKDSKLLIIHCDDLGMTHSVNQAFFDAIDFGLVNSGSILVPCPWLLEISDYAKKNPNVDIGIHLTLTSSLNNFMYGCVSPVTQVPSLVDSNGFFYSNNEDAIKNIKPEEAAIELRNQINRAIAFGVKPSHIDTHQATLFISPPLTQIYLKLSEEFKIPVFLPKEDIQRQFPELFQLLVQHGFIMVDHFFSISSPTFHQDEWFDYYTKVIQNLQPGVTVLIVHLGKDTEELRAATKGKYGWGSVWRQNDFNVFTSEKMKRVIEENDVQLITWKEIGKLLE